MLSTRQKMTIARAFNRAIVGTRRLAGKGSTVEVRRRGINWRLDLDEGIDLALYLNLYQTVPKRVLERWVAPAALVVDVGANVGAMSLLMASRMRGDARVVSVEPTDFAFDKLLANAALNPALQARIVALQAAMSDGSPAAPQAQEFYSRWPLDGDTRQRHPGHEGKFEAASKARFVALDDLLAELRAGGSVRGPVGFMKLDVDGYELTVVKGASKTLSEDKPPILIEIAPHVQDEVVGRFEELVDRLRSFGYALEDAATGSDLPSDAAGLRGHIAQGASLDALARVR
jgi:FkbM family methyltransferase